VIFVQMPFTSWANTAAWQGQTPQQRCGQGHGRSFHSVTFSAGFLILFPARPGTSRLSLACSMGAAGRAAVPWEKASASPWI